MAGVGRNPIPFKPRFSRSMASDGEGERLVIAFEAAKKMTGGGDDRRGGGGDLR